MSGLMHKVKDALSGEKDTPEARAANQGNNEYGTHGAPHHEGTHTGHKSGIDPLDSDLTGKRSEGYDSTSSGLGSGTTGTTGTGTGTGYGSSGYDDNTRTSGTGTHSSGMMNKADPRIDSDRDGRSGMGNTGTTGGDYGRDTTTTGAGYGSSGYGDNTRTSGAGPHNSSMMNKADPHVDSDRDGRSGMGGTTGTSGYDNTSTGGITGTGHHGSHGHHGGITGKAEDIVHGGDHHTSTANKLDPHVSGGGNLENMSGTTGTSTGLGSSGYDDTSRTSGAGPHSSSMMNKGDPRVDSDRDGRSGMGNTTGTGLGDTSRSGYDDTAGTGYGDTTRTSGAGPHSSSMMNKTDPRVDSDRDGRSGMGENTTTGTGYGSSETGTGKQNY